ncbi:unnamed protein product [Oncorhynchus mykiss]|uniref:Uncharacterized protein n=1 Tax=Oncorhynchus mykiss TaxID=8022 RepID=A0A060YCN8_ONCMY|nr:unnamed protein product [Oncorhynchus mykiss]
MQSHTNIAFLQSELDSLKSDLTDHSINSEGYEAMMREFSDERDNLERQIEILQAANRKLNDSNDGLLSSLENSLSKSNKVRLYTCITTVTTPARSLSLALSLPLIFIPLFQSAPPSSHTPSILLYPSSL